jgi:hypothetical protein
VSLADEWEALMVIEPPEFPEAVNGVDLAMLVDDATECVSIYLTTQHLGAVKRGTLRACVVELQSILPTLSGPAADYVGRLTHLAGGVLGQDDLGRAGWLG